MNVTVRLLVFTILVSGVSFDPVHSEGENVVPMLSSGVSLQGSALLELYHYGDEPNDRRVQRPLPESVPFPCKVTTSPEVPTSVHRLRPSDIKVIGNLGSSTSSGSAALGQVITDSFIEYRSVSFSGGGRGTWREFLTLPNILKEFNPRLMGYATHDGPHYLSTSGLNVAIAASLDEDMLSQGIRLIKRMKRDPRIDFKNDWKMITVLIGRNNLCSRRCFNETNNTAEDHARKIAKVLDLFRDRVPRAFVNLLAVTNVSISTSMRKPFLCSLFDHVLCACAARGDKADLSRGVAEYRQAERDLINSGRYEGKEDFTVVYQEYNNNWILPRTKDGRGYETEDISYYSVDCFHFSQKGQALAANELWNNLLEPIGLKSAEHLPLYRRFLCPSEEAPYLFTKENSKRFFLSGRQW